MSSLIVEVCKIDDIQPHDNMDKLELAIIKGWQCITQKGKFQKGDKVVYIPIDSMIPFELSEKLGITNYLHNKKTDENGNIIASRVKTIRLRGALSQGLVIDVQDPSWKVGDDVREKLGIEKYVAKVTCGGNSSRIHTFPKWRLKEYPEFNKYTEIENYKNYLNILEEGEECIATEKIHGCINFDGLVKLYNGKQEKIGKIVNNKLQYSVLGLDDNDNIVPSKITNWFNNGYYDNWKKIKFTRDGLLGNSYGVLIVTDNHEIFNPIKSQYIKCCDFKIGDEILICRKKRCISYLQEQILIGKMIGDGSLSNDSIEFNHKKEDEEYVNYTLKLLGDIAGNKQKDQISGYGTLMCRSRTISDISISEIFKGWYTISGKKETPKYINLSPISLAFWYMDDGSLSHTKKQEDRISLATCGYNSDSIDNLINGLKTIGINSIKFNDGKYWRIRINASESDKFFILIRPYVPKCMQYKLPEKYRTDYNPIIIYSKSKFDVFSMKQKITSIEDYSPKKRYLKIRYNIETETNNYFINGVLVHNSNMRSARLNIDPEYFSFIEKVVLKLKKIGNIMTFGLYSFDPSVFCVGSHNCNIRRSKEREQISRESMGIYWEMALEHELDKILKEGEEIFGEIYGPRVQKYFEYDGLEKIKIRFFDMKVRDKDGIMKYLDWDPFVKKCLDLELPIVPVLYRGPFSREIIPGLMKGQSTIGNHLREGCVIKPIKERFHPKLGRVILKCINDDYLLFKGKKEEELEKQGKEAELDIFQH